MAWKTYTLCNSIEATLTALEQISSEAQSPIFQALASYLLQMDRGRLIRAINSMQSYRLFTTLPSSIPLIWESTISSPNGDNYTAYVVCDAGEISALCSCPDYRKHLKPCKHIAMIILDVLNLKVRKTAEKVAG